MSSINSEFGDEPLINVAVFSDDPEFVEAHVSDYGLDRVTGRVRFIRGQQPLQVDLRRESYPRRSAPSSSAPSGPSPRRRRSSRTHPASSSAPGRRPCAFSGGGEPQPTTARGSYGPRRSRRMLLDSEVPAGAPVDLHAGSIGPLEA